MEDIVYLPMRGQLQAEICVSYHLSDSEWPVSLGPQLLGRVCDMQIGAFQPHSISPLVQFVICGFHPQFLCVLHSQRSFLPYCFKGLLLCRQVWNLEVFLCLVSSGNMSHPQFVRCFLRSAGWAAIYDILYHREPFCPVVHLMVAEDT